MKTKLFSLFCVGVLLVLFSSTPIFAVTLFWNTTATGGQDWNNAANWGGTVPGPMDDIVFPAGCNVTFNTGVPALSLNSITVAAGANFIEFNDPMANLTFFTPSSIGASAQLVLRRGTFIFSGTTMTINGTIQVNANPSVDLVATNGATIFVATGGALQTANGGAISISTGSLLDVQAAAPFGVTNSIGGGGTLTLGIGSTLRIRPGARVQNNAPGVLTVNSGCTIDIQGNGDFTGTSPAYIAGSNLTYTSTPAKTVGVEIPTGVPMNANITVNNAGGVTLGAGVTYQLYGGMTISPGRVLAFNNMTILDLFAGSYCWSGSFQGNTSASLRFMGVVTQLCANITFVAPQQLNTLQLIATGMGLGSNLTVSGALTVSAGQLGIATGAMLTLQGGGTVTPANGIDVLAGGTLNIDGALPLSGVGVGSVQYSNAGATLLYSGGGSFVAGLEFPAVNGPTNLTINKTAGTAVTLPGTRAIPLAPTPGVLTLTSGELRTAGFQMQVLNTALGAVVGGSANSYVSIGAGGAFQRAIQAGGATWNFPVGNITTGYMPLALLAPTGNATVTVSAVTNALASGANGTTTILNPMQDPRWTINPSTGIDAIVQAGFAGVGGTNKIGISPSDAMNSYIGIGGATPDVFTMGMPPILRSVAAATLPIAGSFIRIGNALPTTYFYCPMCGTDPTIAANWRDNGLPGGIAAPSFFAGYTFRIPSGVTATYLASWNVPAGLIYQVDNDGTLEFNGDFNFTGNNIIYQSNLATLRYINGGGGGTGVELPNAPTPMVGTVVINRTNSSNFNINFAKIFNGAVTISSGIVNTTAVNHTFNAAPTALTVNGNGWFYVNGGTTTLTENAILSAGRITLGNATPLSIASGRTLAVSGTGVLELFEFMGSQPQISGLGAATFTPSATLRFTNGWNGTVNLNTLPTPFDGTLDIVNGTPTLATNRILQGNIAIATGTLNVGINVALTLAGAGTITTTGVNRIDAETQTGAGIISQRAILNGNWFTNNLVNNFTLDANATLTNDLTVVNNLGFTSGILTTSVGNELIAGQSLAITGANATRFVNGPMQTTFPAPGVGMTRALPVGKNVTYLPVELRSVTTVAGLNPRVRVEAFDTAPAGGTFPLAPIGNEHWFIQTVANPLVMTQCQIALGRAAVIAPSARQVSKSAPASGTYFDAGSIPTMLPPYNALMGTPFLGFPNGFFALTGAPPSTFYYQSLAAETFANWNSNLNGGGSQPANFSAGTFYVPNGRTAAFSNSAAFGATAILQAESGGAITVANGQTLTHSGTFRINGGGRLTLQGTGNVVAMNGVQYVAPTATLEYNAPSNRLTSGTEFPSTMPAQVEVQSGSLRLDASKHLQSSFLLNNSSLTFGAANRLRLSGSVTFLGANTSFVSDSTDTLVIDGSSTLAGSIGIPRLARLTLNRGGRNLSLNGTTRITQQLGLLGGNISLNANEALILQSSADTALLGGSNLAFVNGALVRQLRPNLTPQTTTPIFYPIGRGNTYLPLTLTEATTGTVAPEVGAEAFNTGAGGTPAIGVPGALSITEHWRVVGMSGSFTGARVGVMRGGITASNTLASSSTPTGLFTSVGGALTMLGQGLSLLGDQASNSGQRVYAIVGTLQSSPRITGFSPSIGGANSTMIITGTNLSSVNALAIGGVVVSSFTVLSSTTISVVLGQVSSGPIQIGSPLGGSASDSSFTFVPAPSIAGVLPNPAGLGTTITIGGNNLGGLNELIIGGVVIPQSAITTNPDGTLTTRVPLTASTSTIVLSTPGGTIISTNALALVAAPTLTSFTPGISPTGATITILGTNFAQGATVLFGTVPALAATVNSSGRITAVVPPQPAPTLVAVSGKNGSSLNSAFIPSVFVTVRTGGGTATSATQFIYSPNPNGGNSGVDPLRMVVLSEARDKLTASGGRVRITGANLELIQELTLRTSISSTKANYLISSSAAITVLIPTTGLLRSTNASLSRALVTVDALGVANRAVAAEMFTLVGAPVISGITPLDVGVGEEVRVSGENLDLITASSIAGTNASFRLINGVLFVKIPADASTGGVLPVGGALTFTSLGGITTTSAAIVNAALASGIPFIAGFSPTSGGAGTVITVTGANFTRVTDAYVGNVPVESFIINSPTQMTLTLGTQATAISVGSVTLVGPFGSASAQTGFIFTSSLAGDMQALERALTLVGLGINDVVIEQTDNRISGVRISDKALNVSLDALVRALGTLTQLRSLDLSNSGLTGAIPAALARFTRLENLNLSRNRLTGAIPTDVICGYPNLRILDVSRNALEGTIPTCLATLGKVRVLNLSENRFTGGLPKELGTMLSLEELWVNNNRLSGNLPPEFGEPLSKTAKTTVRLQSAQTLRLLDVSANEFSGTLPAAWGGITSLQYLNLSNNRLTGALPQSIVNWDALETLRLGNNRFTGQLPALTTTALKTLSLENNAFTGRLPEALGRATRLRVLNAQNNLFSQAPLMVAVVRMDTLNLSGNRLEFGSLETNIGARSFGYAPQDSIGNGGDTVLRSGSRFVLSSGIGGQNTQYQWLRGNIVLPNATAATLTLESAQSFQSGQYVCRASNSRLPELSINTRAVRVVVTGAEAALPQAMLLFPPVRAENIAVRPRLVWSAVQGAEQYELLFARDALLRQGVVRRIVSASAAPSYRLGANDEALERGGEYFWRVRALAVGSEGEASEVRSFRVVPLGVDVGFSTIDAGQTLIGTPSIGDGLIVNVGSSTVRLDSATTPSGTAFTVITGLTNIALAPSEEIPVNVRFTPRASGEAITSVRVFYKDGQQQARNVQFDNILRGKASALRVDAVEFEAVRVGRRALKAVRLINVGNEELTLTGLRIVPVNGSPASRLAASTFTLDSFGNSVLPAGDTTFVTVRCLSMQEADLNAVLAASWRVGGSLDSARVGLRASVRFVNPNNPSVVLGIRPRRDTVAPGSDVPLEVFIAEGNPDALLGAAQPLVRVRVAFDPQVLTLVGGARQLRSSANGGTESTVQVQTQWDRRTGLVVATLNCRALAGLRDTTALRIVGAEWGGGAERLPWEQSVVVEEPLDGKFTTRVSRAGGKRLIGTASAQSLVEIRPNPANAEAEIVYVLAKADDVELTLVNGNGALVQRLFSGMQEAGEYSIRAVLKGVSSGTYHVVLRTKNGTESATMNVVK